MDLYGSISLSKTFSIENSKELENLLAGQVFTPCGRYGISYPNKIDSTLPVVDIFRRRISHYKYVGNINVQCDIIYCLNSSEFMSIKATPTMFKQQIWHLNHQKETFMLKSTKNFKHKVNSDGIHIHERCRADIILTFDKEDHNIWISSLPHQLDHHLLFLIPRNPNSIANMKLFYVNLSRVVRSNHSVYRKHKLNEVGSLFIPPQIRQNWLYFPVSIGEKQLLGVSGRINPEELIDVIDMDQVDLEMIIEMQRGNAYKVGILPYELFPNSEHPVVKCSFAFGSNSDIHGGVIPNHKYDVYVEGVQNVFFFSFRKGEQNVHRINSKLRSGETMSVHPSGLLIAWSNSDIGIKIRKLGLLSYKGEQPSLYTRIQRNLILQEENNFYGIPGFENILFNSNCVL